MQTTVDEISQLLTDGESTDAAAASNDALPDLGWARAVLAGKRSDPPVEVDEDIAEALVQQLASNSDAETIAWLAATKQKLIAKLARKALHQLRSKGVEVPQTAGTAPLAGDLSSVSEKKELPSLLTLYDSGGYRAVWLAYPGLRGVDLIATRISRQVGLVSYDWRSLPRRKYRGLVKRLCDETSALIVPRDQAAWFVYDGIRRCEAAGRVIPANINRALREVGEETPTGNDPAHAIEPLDGDVDATMQIEALRSWLPERDVLQKLLLRHQEIATSDLYVSDNQRTEQWQATLDRTIRDYFNEERQTEARQHLLDTAHALLVQGREIEARRVRGIAESFAAKYPCVDNPFARALFAQFFPPNFESQATR